MNAAARPVPARRLRLAAVALAALACLVTFPAQALHLELELGLSADATANERNAGALPALTGNIGVTALTQSSPADNMPDITITPQAPLAAAAESPAVAQEQGGASWYARYFHGRRTANGERYDQNELTAAHKTLPFGTVVRVRSEVNGKEVDVRINDRGPFVAGRVIDLSQAAAKALGMLQVGVKRVTLLLPARLRPAERTASNKSGATSGTRPSDTPDAAPNSAPAARAFTPAVK